MRNISEIAIQNDDFRKHLSKGTLVLTQGIRSNAPEDIQAIITKVRTFDKFDENNDPYNEHDFANHRNIGTTQHYFNYNEKMLANAVENVKI